MSPDVALALSVAAHAGFQLTVTAIVYPALLEVPADRWREAHARHSARITPVVGVVYLLLAGTGGWALANGWSPLVLVTGALIASVVLVTALGAAPIHGRLRPDDVALRRRLLHVDRLRCLLALAAVVPSVLAVA
ncbi:hypothetical protein ABFT23_18175 [Nocardioides sp. C4-1]|uniref:hypothetical protein n=1 Tax=Nocardioides sp. C4-1 TaxID=3151851 RepID=UPI003264F392